MAYYRDLREYIRVLEESGKLVRIRREINKDTVLMPMVRWQYRGLDEKDRKAFLFECVTDSRGNHFDGQVLVAAHAGSREICALALACRVEEIGATLERAQLHPIKPIMVDSGPTQEEVHMGDRLLEHGGLDELAVPISTPGFDNAPYFSAGCTVTKDPDTGVRNVGDYRCMVKSPTRLGLRAQMPQHVRQHWEKYRRKGIPMPVAISVGPTPNVGLVSATRVPYGVDEYDVAGGMSGEPVHLVKCKTVDLEVPATAEIVVEGNVPTDWMEKEGPHGEANGYIGMGDRAAMYVDVTCITHRRRPIWAAYISQFPPSESSVLKAVGTDSTFLKVLKHDLGLDCALDVAFHDDASNRQFCVVVLKRATRSQVWQALYGITAASTNYAKITIAVDDDIDPRDMDSVVWALSYRMQPHRDVQIVQGRTAALDLSAVPQGERGEMMGPPLTSSILIDATRKWAYPPTALPAKEFMEMAKAIWEEEGLPPLKPKMPWYGTSLGYWPRELEEEAELAVRGEYYQTGEKFANSRIKM